MPSTSLESNLQLDFASLFAVGESILTCYHGPLVLIHPNVFWTLMGCSVLNFLYQLDISLVEICFIYTWKLGTGGC